MRSQLIDTMVEVRIASHSLSGLIYVKISGLVYVGGIQIFITGLENTNLDDLHVGVGQP
jgi:hypothetical protein